MALEPSALSPAISSKMSGWKIRANIPARKDDMNNVINGGTFFAINNPVKIGTTSNQGVIVKLSSIDSENWAIWLLDEAE